MSRCLVAALVGLLSSAFNGGGASLIRFFVFQRGPFHYVADGRPIDHARGTSALIGSPIVADGGSYAYRGDLFAYDQSTGLLSTLSSISASLAGTAEQGYRNQVVVACRAWSCPG